MPEVETNNHDLSLALTQQPGEDAARMTVKRKGQPVPYSELEKLTTSGLVECDITSFGIPVKIWRNNMSHISGEEYVISGGPGYARTYLGERQSASKGLESFYQLGIAVLSGNP